MSVLSQDTFVIQGAAVGGVGTGGGTFSSTFSSLYVADSTVTTSLISAEISTIFLEAEEAFISSISTLGVYLDGNLLTSAGNELLLNGIPLATNSSLSSIADWAIDPAISSVQMNGNVIVQSAGYTGTGTVSTGSLVADSASISTLSTGTLVADTARLSALSSQSISTGTLVSDSASITNLVCQDISTISLTVLSTIHDISTISSLFVIADSILASSINGSVYPPLPASTVSTFNTASVSSLSVSSINDSVYPPLPVSTVSTFNTASVSSLSVSSINGAVFPQPGADVSQWATFPAVSTITNSTVAGLNFKSDAKTNVTAPAYMSLTATNGSGGYIDITSQSGFGDINGGRINLTANGGGTFLPAAGSFGRIDITANGGVPAPGYAIGGLINITANTPIGSFCNATSAININAAGVNSYAGAVPSIASVAGYNFIYGSLGTSLCAGAPPSGFQVPGTTYLYGTNGIVLNANVYTTYIQPYQYGILNPADMMIAGRSANYGLGNYTALVNVSTIGTLDFSQDTRSPARIRYLQSLQGNNLEITSLSSINGQPYTGGAGPGGIQSSIANGTASVNIDATGTILMTNENSLGQTVTVFAEDNLVLKSNNNSVLIQCLDGGSEINLDPNGNIFLNAASPGVVQINSTLNVGEVTGVSSIVGTGAGPMNFRTYGESYFFDGNMYVPGFEASSIVAPSMFPSTLNAIAHGAIHMYAPLGLILSDSISVSSINNVSTVNGMPWNGGGGVPNDLVVSSITIDPAGTLSTSNIAVGTSTLITSGHEGDIVINAVDVFINTVDGATGGNLVLGSLQSVSSIQAAVATPLNFQSLGAGYIFDSTVSVSTLTDVSTINGQPYPPPGSGVTSTFSTLVVSSLIGPYFAGLPGASINLADTNVGGIIMDAQYGDVIINNAPTLTVNTQVISQSVQTSTVGTFELTNVSSINNISYPPQNINASTVNITSTLEVAKITSLSTTTPGTVPASIQFDPAFGAMTIYSGRAHTLLLSTFNTQINSPNGLTVAGGPIITGHLEGASTLTGAFGFPLEIQSDAGINFTGIGNTNFQIIGNTNISSLYVSSVNGEIYPPPSSGGSPNAQFSTVSVSSFITAASLTAAALNSVTTLNSIPVTGNTISPNLLYALNVSTPVVTAVSTLNSIQFADNIITNVQNIITNNVEVANGIILDGAGTFTINGNPGQEGNVIQISNGYPEWVALPVAPQTTYFYNQTSTSTPIASTFNTVLSTTVLQTQTEGLCVSATANFSGTTTGDIIQATLFVNGSGITLPTQNVQTTAGPQQVTVGGTFRVPSLGVPLELSLVLNKGLTDNTYVVQNAIMNVTADINFPLPP